jgi:glycolate oxidase
MLTDSVIHKLENIIGKERVKKEIEDKIAYSYDAYIVKGSPDVVVFPKSTKEVIEIAKIANEENIPITPRGSGSNLSGCSIPKKGGIAMCFSMMNQTIEINKKNRYAIVEPGKVLKEFQNEVEKQGLFYPPDPASNSIATIGGTVAMNSGGIRGAKYGVTRDYLLGLEAVLIDGSIIKTGCLTTKNVAGYDLTSLLCGSEGTLAFITKITLKLLPKPPAKKTILALYSDLNSATNTVSKIIANGIVPSALELMDDVLIKATSDYVKIDYLKDVNSLLLIELDGNQKTIDAETEEIIKLCKESGSKDIKIAFSLEQSEELWKARRSTYGAVARLRPTCIVEDATVPVEHLPLAVIKVKEIAKKYGLFIGILAHAADGNMHPQILTDEGNKEELEKIEKATSEIFDFAISVGGTITGEHGIGLAKKKYLSKQIDSKQLNLMREIKKNFDPKNLINPNSFID